MCIDNSDVTSYKNLYKIRQITYTDRSLDLCNPPDCVIKLGEIDECKLDIFSDRKTDFATVKSQGAGTA